MPGFQVSGGHTRLISGERTRFLDQWCAHQASRSVADIPGLKVSVLNSMVDTPGFKVSGGHTRFLGQWWTRQVLRSVVDTPGFNISGGLTRL